MSLAEYLLNRVLHKASISRMLENPTKQKMSKVEEDEIVRRYENGESAAEIGRSIKWSKNTVSKVVKRRGKARGYKEAQRLNVKHVKKVFTN